MITEDEVFSPAPSVATNGQAVATPTKEQTAAKKERAERRPSNHPEVLMERFESLSLSEASTLLKALQTSHANKVAAAKKELEEQQARLNNL